MGKYNEKYFKDDGMSSNKIEDLIEADEEIGKNSFTNFLFLSS